MDLFTSLQPCSLAVFNSFFQLAAVTLGSHTYELISLLLTVATFVVVLVQLKLMSRQTRLMENQNEILTRKSNLKVIITKQNKLMQLYAENTGKRSASNFYWHIYVPYQHSTELILSSSDRTSIPTQENLPIGGVDYVRYSSHYSSQIHSGRTAQFAVITVPDKLKLQSIEILWQLVNDDAVFPTENTIDGSNIGVIDIDG